MNGRNVEVGSIQKRNVGSPGTRLLFAQHRLLHALHFGFVAGLSGLTVSALVLGYVFSPAWLQKVSANGYAPFVQTSFWNTPLPRYPVLHDDAAIAEQMIAPYASSANLDTQLTAAAVYDADMSVPASDVTPVDCGDGIDGSLANDWQTVPIPYYAQPSVGGRMVIRQPATQAMWEFSGLQKVSGQWQACHGGKIDNVGASQGVFSGSHGITGSGLAYMGGGITLDDIQRGIIGHVIGLSVPNSSADYNWPAIRGGMGSGSMHMGMRLQLDPLLDVSSLGLSPIAQKIALAAQTYGFVIWDDAPSLSISGESPISYTSRGLANPYGSLGDLSLDGFPWDRLRALPSAYGQNGMTPQITEFSASAARADPGQQTHFSWRAVNVDQCTIPGVIGSSAAIGATTAHDIKADTQYTLLCAGPGGSTSSVVAVELTDKPLSDPKPTQTTTSITLPMRGSVPILPFFDTEEARQTIQKVVYYEKENFLQSSTNPPFTLNTTAMRDGAHSLDIRVHFRDGHVSKHAVSLDVQNVAAHVYIPSMATGVNAYADRKGILMTAGVLIAGMMLTSSWYGWQKIWPRRIQSSNRLITYVS